MNRNSRILVVDDQEDLRTQVAKMLRQRLATQETASLIDQIRQRIGKGRDSTPANDRETYEVDCFAQGKEAYEGVKASLAEDRPYSVMFLDMRMPPGWDGLETAQRIRSVDREIQIVIMTAYADYDQTEIAEKLGEPDKLIYLKKPFHPEEIRQLALALSEKWNLDRREKERQILTTRLMRENGFLTRHTYGSLDSTLRCLLDAFVSFLDASSGIVIERQPGGSKVRLSTSSDDAEAMLESLSEEEVNTARTLTNDKTGTCLLPVLFPEFDGLIMVNGKKIQYSYTQLRQYIDILLETARSVLRNALVMNNQSSNDALAITAELHGLLELRVANGLSALQKATLPPDVQPAVQALAACQHDLALLHQAGAHTLEIAEVSLHAVLDGVLAAQQAALDATRITVSKSIIQDASVLADRTLLGWATELILNQAKSDMAGGGELSLTVSPAENQPDRLTITISWASADASKDCAPLRLLVGHMLQRFDGHCLIGAKSDSNVVLVMDLPTPAF